jgi:hypothetical protein
LFQEQRRLALINCSNSIIPGLKNKSGFSPSNKTGAQISPIDYQLYLVVYIIFYLSRRPCEGNLKSHKATLSAC